MSTTSLQTKSRKQKQIEKYEKDPTMGIIKKDNKVVRFFRKLYKKDKTDIQYHQDMQRKRARKLARKHNKGKEIAAAKRRGRKMEGKHENNVVKKVWRPKAKSDEVVVPVVATTPVTKVDGSVDDDVVSTPSSSEASLEERVVRPKSNLDKAEEVIEHPMKNLKKKALRRDDEEEESKSDAKSSSSSDLAISAKAPVLLKKSDSTPEIPVTEAPLLTKAKSAPAQKLREKNTRRRRRTPKVVEPQQLQAESEVKEPEIMEPTEPIVMDIAIVEPMETADMLDKESDEIAEQRKTPATKITETDLNTRAHENSFERHFSDEKREISEERDSSTNESTSSSSSYSSPDEQEENEERALVVRPTELEIIAISEPEFVPKQEPLPLELLELTQKDMDLQLGNSSESLPSDEKPQEKDLEVEPTTLHTNQEIAERAKGFITEENPLVKEEREKRLHAIIGIENKSVPVKADKSLVHNAIGSNVSNV